MASKLMREVWALGRCSGCGACVAACSKGVLHWNEGQHPLLEDREKAIGLSRLKLRTCEVCERFCELSCPRLREWTPIDPRAVYSARSAGVVRSGTPNDVIQALLVAARSADLIDGVVMPDIDSWTLAPTARVATTVDEIVSGVGVQYLWTPVLDALNEAVFDLNLTKLAVLGPPCVAEGARQIMSAENPRLQPYRRALRLVIAPFCTGVYMSEMITDLLERVNGISRHQIRSLTASTSKGQMTASLWDGAEHEIPLTEVETFSRLGCARCRDLLGEQADIAVGAIGAQEGFATLIVRTLAGETTFQNALHFGLLEAVDHVDTEVLGAAKAEKDRRSLAQDFDSFRILMLDALADPMKRAVVRKQYVRLYGAPGRKAAKEKSDVACGGC